MKGSVEAHGFSLIELMIVIAIIGILAVIAIPSYQNYTMRARFTEVVTATEPFKTAVSLAIQQGVETAGLNNGENGIPKSPEPTKHLASVLVEEGVITATSTDLLNQTNYILTPNADGTVWEISGSCRDEGWCND